MDRLIARWQKYNQQPSVKTLTCAVCEYSDDVSTYKVYEAQDQFHAGTLIRYQCPKCDVIFGDLRFLALSPEEIADDYTDLYSYYNECDSTALQVECYRHIGLDTNLSYLDYACGTWAKHIEALQSQEYNVKGYDKYVGKYSTRPSEPCDVVYCNNYIEHVINPIADVKDMVDLVKPGGLLVLATDCFEYTVSGTHYHTFFFIGRSLNIICEKVGIVLDTTLQVRGGPMSTTVKIFRKLA